MYVRNITANDKLETMKLSSLCFEYPFQTNNQSEEDFLQNLLAHPTDKIQANWFTQLAAFDDKDDFMACMAALPYQFYFDGKVFSGNGIGNVCTYPHHRKKGAIKAMFQKMLTDSYQSGQAFSYLYPFSEGFYGKFGYHRLSNSTEYDLRLVGFPNDSYPGSFHLLTEENTSLLAEFKTAYTIFAKKFNMMVQRDDFDWTIVTDAKAYVNNNYAYLYKDENGTPCGYVVFKKSGRTLKCRELVFDSLETLKAIFSFIKTYATDYDIFHFYAPSTIHMEHFCTDFSIYPATCKVAMNGMARVVNVETVLKNAKYIGSGSLPIIIEDKWIPENNGLFEVTFENGVAKEVTFTPLEKVESADAYTRMNISLFSAAIVGNYSVEDFAYIDGIELKAEQSVLAQVFYKKNCFINNYF